MKNYKYLIIGGGMTTSAGIDGIRSIDKEGSICIISDEKYKPYERPPLTKGLWQDTKMDSIFIEMDESNVHLHLNKKATEIDKDNKIVKDSSGKKYKYTKLLIATGATPKTISKPSKRIIYYRNLQDYKDLRSLTEKYSNFGVIGGGFIGSEIAAALSLNKKKVTMIFLEEGIGGLLFPKELSTHLNSYYKEKGIEIYPKSKVQQITEVDNKIKVKTDTNEFSFDALVIGIGVNPNIELLQSNGFNVENGVIVNEFLQTSVPDIYAAGDVAKFYSPSLDRMIRVEHEDNAYEQGKVAGKNMAGSKIKYEHLPFFYSDLFDYGYEAIGILDPKLNIIEDWKDEFNKGVVYYLQNEIVVGVLLWNVWDQIEYAGELIANKMKMDKEELTGFLPRE